jgi:hypothetical protein
MAEGDSSRSALGRLEDWANGEPAKADFDVLLYNGALARPHDSDLIDQCVRRQVRRKKVFLVLTTAGGDPHSAYRIGRALQQSYERVTAYVPGYCKSAGTLLLMAAHEIVMTHHAELGPLDVQVLRSDEVGVRSSGLAPQAALDVLEARVSAAFFAQFEKLRKLQMATALAAEVSADLAASMYRGIFEQIDPIRLGELERANQIALKYGERLLAVSQNAKTDETLPRLVAAYPSHGFVIDHAEANELFKEVRLATPEEESAVISFLRDPFSDEEAIVRYLNSPPGARDGNERTDREVAADRTTAVAGSRQAVGDPATPPDPSSNAGGAGSSN